MTKLLDQALLEVARLPDFEQDRIGRGLQDYLARRKRLRADLDEGIRSLDAGEGREIDIELVIERARERDAGR